MRGIVLLVVLLAATSVASAKQMPCMGPGELTLPATVEQPGDTSPPAPPVLSNVSVTGSFAMRDGRPEVSTIYVTATYAPDTSIVRVGLADSAGHTGTITTTPGHPFLCPGSGTLALNYGPIEVTVIAIDAAGNASAPATMMTQLSRPHPRHGNMGLILFLLLAAALSVVGWAIFMIARTLRRRGKLTEPGTPIAPLAAETMAHRIVAETLFTIALGCGLALMLYFSYSPIAAGIVMYWPIARLFRLVAVKRFIGYLDQGAQPLLHDNIVAWEGSFIVVPRRIIKTALDASVPQAISRRVI